MSQKLIQIVRELNEYINLKLINLNLLYISLACVNKHVKNTFE